MSDLWILITKDGQVNVFENVLKNKTTGKVNIDDVKLGEETFDLGVYPADKSKDVVSSVRSLVNNKYLKHAIAIHEGAAWLLARILAPWTKTKPEKIQIRGSKPGVLVPNLEQHPIANFIVSLGHPLVNLVFALAPLAVAYFYGLPDTVTWQIFLAAYLILMTIPNAIVGIYNLAIYKTKGSDGWRVRHPGITPPNEVRMDIDAMVKTIFLYSEQSSNTDSDTNSVVVQFQKNQIESLMKRHFHTAKFDFYDYQEPHSSFAKFFHDHGQTEDSLRNALYRMWELHVKYENVMGELNVRLRKKLEWTGFQLDNIVFSYNAFDGPFHNQNPQRSGGRRNIEINVEFLFSPDSDIFGVSELAHEAGHGLIKFMENVGGPLEERKEMAANWAAAHLLSAGEIGELVSHTAKVQKILFGGKVHHHTASHLIPVAARYGNFLEIVKLRRWADWRLVLAYNEYYKKLRWRKPDNRVRVDDKLLQLVKIESLVPILAPGLASLIVDAWNNNHRQGRLRRAMAVTVLLLTLGLFGPSTFLQAQPQTETEETISTTLETMAKALNLNMEMEGGTFERLYLGGFAKYKGGIFPVYRESRSGPYYLYVYGEVFNLGDKSNPNYPEEWGGYVDDLKEAIQEILKQAQESKSKPNELKQHKQPTIAQVTRIANPQDAERVAKILLGLVDQYIEEFSSKSKNMGEPPIDNILRRLSPIKAKGFDLFANHGDFIRIDYVDHNDKRHQLLQWEFNPKNEVKETFEVTYDNGFGIYLKNKDTILLQTSDGTLEIKATWNRTKENYDFQLKFVIGFQPPNKNKSQREGKTTTQQPEFMHSFGLQAFIVWLKKRIWFQRTFGNVKWLTHDGGVAYTQIARDVWNWVRNSVSGKGISDEGDAASGIVPTQMMPELSGPSQIPPDTSIQTYPSQSPSLSEPLGYRKKADTIVPTKNTYITSLTGIVYSAKNLLAKAAAISIFNTSKSVFATIFRRPSVQVLASPITISILLLKWAVNVSNIDGLPVEKSQQPNPKPKSVALTIVAAGVWVSLTLLAIDRQVAWLAILPGVFGFGALLDLGVMAWGRINKGKYGLITEFQTRSPPKHWWLIAENKNGDIVSANESVLTGLPDWLQRFYAMRETSPIQRSWGWLGDIIFAHPVTDPLLLLATFLDHLQRSREKATFTLPTLSVTLPGLPPDFLTKIVEIAKKFAFNNAKERIIRIRKSIGFSTDTSILSPAGWAIEHEAARNAESATNEIENSVKEFINKVFRWGDAV